jgi:iron complex outermembrane receptor protein
MTTGAATTAGAPVKFHREYKDVLPNVGATWRFAENQSVFLNYSENLSAPRTDDLYDRIPSDPEPETSKNIDLGYRWQSGRLLASASTFYSKFDNYIVRALTELEGGETIATSINVGKVDRWGADGQIGFEATDNLTLYASASYLGSEVQQDTPRTGAGADWPTKGKEIFEVPAWQFAARAQYAVGDLTVGLQAKWVDERWTNLLNDESTAYYTVVDADVRYALNFINDTTYLQLNIQNLLDEEYLADISTEITGNRTANLGAPRSAILTLRTQF